MPVKNKELAQAVLDKIREDREHWSQLDWAGYAYDDQYHVCGTTHCFGGWAAVLAGAKFSNQTYRWRDKHGHVIPSVEAFAAKQLGLTPAEANDIFFNFTNDFEVLATQVKEVFEL